MGTTFRNWFLKLSVVSLTGIFLLTGCDDVQTYAPVYEINNIEPIILHLAKSPSPSVGPILKHQADSRVVAWIWPVNSHPHAYHLVNKGVDIQGDLGEAILAVAKGKVVYSGQGLRGYGKLIIIKHNQVYLSVYAHNQEVFVREGEWVKQGQKIATMGNTGTNSVKLHFEIRRLGKPINPLILHPPKPV